MSSLNSPDNETLRLLALERLNIMDTPVEEQFERITRIALSMFNVPFAGIVLVDQERAWIKSAPGLGQFELPRGQSICSDAILSDQPYVVEDTLQSPKHRDSVLVTGEPGIRFYAGIPLTIDDEYNVGTLCLLDTRPRNASDIDIDLLGDLAKIVESELNATALSRLSIEVIESKKKLQETSVQLQTSARLNSLRTHTLELIAGSHPLTPILTSIVEGVELEYDEMICSILLLQQNSQTLTKGAAPSLPDFYNSAIEGVTIGDGIGSCGTAAYTGQRVVVEDIYSHPYWAPFVDLARQANLGSCWSEPIISSNGKVLGTFAIYHRGKSTPSEEDFRLIEQSAYLASISIERDRANQLIWKQANFDCLTGLPNRSLSREHLRMALIKAQRRENQLALLYLDLDLFKEVNDSLGHDIGDLLLIEAAARIKSCVRETDNVARLGGDEFIIIMSDITDQQGVNHVAEKVLKQLSQVFRLRHEQARISTSIGITIYPEDGRDIDSLMKNADQAMYKAKQLGRNCYHYFNQSMRNTALKRMVLIKDLHKAIDNQEFFLQYQPIVNMHTGSITKAEALIRWQHPKRGLISPEDFIPLAEETGLILAISDWVFEQATTQVIKWRECYQSDFQISINTSPAQYRDNHKNILEWLALIKQKNLDPGALSLEITENLLMDSQNFVSEQLAQLRQYGVEIAMDDFGTGYSSFSYLKQFPFDYLKIDRSFIQNMSKDNDDAILCEAVVAMAKKLKIKVIAEGIETAEQKQLLLEMGCQFGQGYYLSRPLDLDDFNTLLETNSKQHRKTVSA